MLHEVGSGSLSLGSVGLPGKASEHEADHRKIDVGDGESGSARRRQRPSQGRAAM